MMNARLTYPSLSQQVLPGKGLLRGAGLCLGFSLFTALLAQVSLPLPWTPVPITGQTLAVLLTGAVLGPRLGFAAMLLYLAEGAAGLPVYAGGAGGIAALVGPTGGYLISFPLAAALVGALARMGWDRNPLSVALAMVAGNGLIYALGMAWLGVWLAVAGKFGGLFALLNMGMLPFLPGDAVKIALAMLLLPVSWRLVGKSGPG